VTEEKPTDIMLATRVDREVHAKFNTMAEMHRMNISGLLREIVIGFIEGRVTIAPPKDLLFSVTNDKE